MEHITLDSFVVDNVIVDTDYRVRLVATDGRVLTILLETDCCDVSYFDQESLEVFRGLFGHQILSLEEAEANGVPKRDCRKEVQKIHALIVRTDKMSETLMWRNDSNGYYEGRVRLHIQ